MYLLDTNILIYLRKEKDEGLRRRLFEKGPDSISYSVVSEFELLTRQGDHVVERTRLLLMPFSSVNFDSDCATMAARIRKMHDHLSIELKDLFIAATAQTKRLTLVSNDRFFERIEGLKLENWTSEAK